MILTICIPTYNRANYLNVCLQNLLPQVDKYKEDIEVIVIDNNSTDETNLIVNKYLNDYSFLKYHINESNIGYTGNQIMAYTLPNGFYTEENFWIPARERFFKDILEVDMLSGEPFIQQDTYRLIEEVSSVNPECQWTFTTNLHWKLTDEVKKKLDKIIIKNIITSFDSLNNETYAKIRKGGDLRFVLKNLDEILKYQAERVNAGKSKLNIRVNFLIQQDNWKEVKEMIHFCFEKHLTPFITFLYEPEKFSILNVDVEIRKKMLDFYFENLNNEELLLIQRVLKPIIRSLSKIEYVYYINLLHNRVTR